MQARHGEQAFLVCAITTCNMAYEQTSNDCWKAPITSSVAAYDYAPCGDLILAIINTVSSILHSPFSILHSYAYDAIGNRLSAAANAMTNTYSANHLNQYSSILCASVPLCELSYDLDGNLLSDGVWSYAFDADGRLFSSTSASLTNGAIRVLNAYDYRHRRTSKTVQRLHSTMPPPPSPPVGEFEWRTVETRTFVYDDWHLIHETVCTIEGGVTNLSEIQHFWGLDLSGTLQGAGGVGGLLATSVNGDYYFPAYDNNGNVTKYIDESGNVVASYTYDAFGKTISATGPLAHLFRHRFSTKYFDSETGLYYYGYRYYSPPLMRWLNRDPIEEDGGENLYAFCGNNGVANFDSLCKIPVKFVSWRESLSGYENVEVHAVSDIEVETGTMRDHGGFSPIFVPSSGQCELEVRLKITLSDGLVHHAPNSVSYTYQPHFAKAGSDILGGGVSSTIPYGQPQIYDEVLAHERGHAWAFLLFTKPIFEAYASTVKAPVKSSDVPILKRMFSKSRMLSASKSAEYANEATINWFTSHGFDIFYDGRAYEFK